MLLVLALGCPVVTVAEHEARIDGDGDGFLDAAFGGDDCDDDDATVNPGADEVCGGVDENCDGLADEGAVDGTVVFADADGDGYGDAGAPATACGALDGHVANADDCDDTLAAVYPGAPETNCDDPVDYNCDGSSGSDDADGDGSIACEDCDDTDGGIHPGAEELCDGLDQDCDGESDEDPVDAPSWYADADGDGYGGGDAFAACEQPEGYVADATDCDDNEAGVNPGASEVCDDADQDCDELVDELAECEVDTDGDGVVDWREELAGTDPSEVDSDGDGLEDGEEASLGTDPLDPDSDGDGLPDGDEVAYGLDPLATDTDGDGQDDYDEVTADTDGDGLTDWDEAGTWGTDPGNADTDGDGLADGDDVSAGADPLDPDSDGDGVDDGTEVALGLDATSSDSDGDGIDDATEVAAEFTWYADADGDGFGDAGGSAVSATVPAGYVDDATDCDDGDAAVNPGASEVWYDGLDSDCSGGSDLDQDGDGYESDAWGGDDCDDLDAGRYPGAGTWSVPGDAATIQEAIDVACTLDEITVAAGTWSENIDFGSKVLDVVGAGLDVTTISGTDYAPVVTMAGGSLQGFTIRDGASRLSGGGVRIDGATSAVLSDLYVVENATSDDGGGIAIVNSGEITIRDCQIVGNEASGNGGGLSYGDESAGAAWALEVQSVSILGNQADGEGGGAYVEATAAVSLSSVDIEENYASGVNALSGTADVTWLDGALTGNAGGGTAVSLAGITALTGLEVSRNTGGLTFDGDLAADDVRIRGTSSSAAAVLWVTGYAELIDVSLVGNTAPSMVAVEGGFDLTRIEVIDSDVDSGGVAVQLTGSGTAQHIVIAGVEDGSGLQLVADDAAAFQEIGHVTVVGSEQYGVTLSGVTDYQFELEHLLVADSGYTGMLGISYRVGLTWASFSGGTYGEYSGLDLSSADWTTILSDTPAFISYDPEMPAWAWDLHLVPGSALVDVDTSEADADGSDADIGAYGGAAADADWYDDVDADGMPDGWEGKHGLDPATDDSADDLDGDGVTNGEELLAGTDPDDADTDDDGADDSESEPLSADLDEDAEVQLSSTSTGVSSLCSVSDMDGNGADELAIQLYGGGYYFQYFVDEVAAGTQSMNSGDNGPISWWVSFRCTGIAGDFDNDGDDDVAISSVPSLLVVKGPFTGSVTPDGGTNASYATAGYAGVADDFNRDGIDDLVVTSPSYSDTYSNGGAVFLYTDVAASLVTGSSMGTSDATLTIEGSGDNDYFGGELVLGDINGDGDADLAMSDTYASYVFYGPFTSTGTLASTDADVATRIDPARVYDTMGDLYLGGDLDGDGIDELVVRQGSGSAGLWVLSDPSDGVVLSDSAQFIADTSRGSLQGLVKGGDLDGDGLGDLFVGASGAEQNDTLLVFLGSSSLASERTADDAERALYDGESGTGLLGDFQVGDFDGDGTSDIAADIGVSNGYPGVEFFFGSGF